MPLIYLLQTPAFFISFCFIIGLMAGSFLNMVIHRLPSMLERQWRQQCAGLAGETIDASPQPINSFLSHPACPHCGHKVTALEGIPVAGYVISGGHCSQCSASISLRYPAIEALTGFASGFIAWHFGYGLAAFAALLFVWALIVLAFIDMDTQLLPNDITLPMLWGGLLVNLGDVFTDTHSAIIGAVVGYLMPWSAYWCFKLVTGKECMGYGDFKLLAVIGAWLGWQMLPLAILFSSVAGTIIGIGLIAVGKHGRHVPMPFGPYLAGGGFIALLWGSQINRAYFDLLQPL